MSQSFGKFLLTATWLSRYLMKETFLSLNFSFFFTIFKRIEEALRDGPSERKFQQIIIKNKFVTFDPIKF